ncbi:hypothetical protein EU537_09560 [Candidatus Thorarchaeota archaeon]|nr:MAG: hypothetical protein EU537_09560 [Candidatus Thorarchaeota archaeon]
MKTSKTHSNENQTGSEMQREAVLAYLTKKNSVMAAFSAILSIMLFSIWTLRSGLDLLTSLLLVTSYGMASVIVALSDYREIKAVGKHHFLLRKTAVSWKLVTDALIGLALSFFFLWFVFASNEANSQIVGQLIMLIAMICTVIVMPLLPLLGVISKLSSMKSKITAQVDENYSSIISLNVKIHPLDIQGIRLSGTQSFNGIVKEIILEFVTDE